MIKGVATVWLPVEDMDRALDFYRDTLGLSEKMHEGEWAEVEANGLTIGLNAREESSSGRDAGAVISFQPEGNLEDAVSALERDGVTFTGGISDHPWGRIAPFRDPDGNDLQLYTPPTG